MGESPVATILVRKPYAPRIVRQGGLGGWRKEVKVLKQGRLGVDARGGNGQCLVDTQKRILEG